MGSMHMNRNSRMDRTNESKKRAVLELQYVTHILYVVMLYRCL